MTILKRNSKVSPIETTPTPQNNNFFVKDNGPIRRIKFAMIIQTVLGINRLNLLNYGGFVKWLGFIYSFILVSLTISALVVNFGDDYSASHSVLKLTTCIEYCLLVLSATLMMKNKLQSFYYDIGKFDAMLNIDKNLNLTSPIYTGITYFVFCVVYFICEYIILSMYFPHFQYSTFTPVWYFTMLAHDSEQIHYVMLIRFILIRLQVLKGHVTKAFYIEDKESKPNETGKLENLANNTELDTSGMHRAYELLHKCAEDLNTAMSFQVNDPEIDLIELLQETWT